MIINPKNTVFKILKHYAKKMSNNENNSQRAETIVRTHVLWAMGAGFIPLPVADALAVAAVQLDMIRQMSGLYGIAFAETQGKAIISSLAGSALSRLGANALIKAIPIVGTFIGGASMAAVSGASTYAVGQVFKRHFEIGGSFVDFDTSRFKKFYDEQFDKGKSVAEDLKKEEEAKRQDGGKADQSKKQSNNDSNHSSKTEIKIDGSSSPVAPPPVAPAADDSTTIIVRKLKELAELKEMGVISDDEFAQMKARLIENYK
jgi:uncharacterized protein (DUF697 family)